MTFFLFWCSSTMNSNDWSKHDLLVWPLGPNGLLSFHVISLREVVISCCRLCEPEILLPRRTFPKCQIGSPKSGDASEDPTTLRVRQKTTAAFQQRDAFVGWMCWGLNSHCFRMVGMVINPSKRKSHGRVSKILGGQNFYGISTAWFLGYLKSIFATQPPKQQPSTSASKNLFFSWGEVLVDSKIPMDHSMSPLCSVGSKCRAFGAFMADVSEESEMGHPASNGSDVGPGDFGGWLDVGWFLKIHKFSWHSKV